MFYEIDINSKVTDNLDSLDFVELWAVKVHAG